MVSTSCVILVVAYISLFESFLPCSLKPKMKYTLEAR